MLRQLSFKIPRLNIFQSRVLTLKFCFTPMSMGKVGLVSEKANTPKPGKNLPAGFLLYLSATVLKVSPFFNFLSPTVFLLIQSAVTPYDPERQVF